MVDYAGYAAADVAFGIIGKPVCPFANLECPVFSGIHGVEIHALDLGNIIDVVLVELVGEMDESAQRFEVVHLYYGYWFHQKGFNTACNLRKKTDIIIILRIIPDILSGIREC